LLSVTGYPVDSDWELSLAELDLIVGVFRRPDVDSERDGSDENENEAEFGESLHCETCLFEIFIFCSRIGGIRFRGIIPYASS